MVVLSGGRSGVQRSMPCVSGQRAMRTRTLGQCWYHCHRWMGMSTFIDTCGDCTRWTRASRIPSRCYGTRWLPEVLASATSESSGAGCVISWTRADCAPCTDSCPLYSEGNDGTFQSAATQHVHVRRAASRRACTLPRCVYLCHRSPPSATTHRPFRHCVTLRAGLGVPLVLASAESKPSSRKMLKIVHILWTRVQENANTLSSPFRVPSNFPLRCRRRWCA